MASRTPSLVERFALFQILPKFMSENTVKNIKIGPHLPVTITIKVARVSNWTNQ